MEESAEEERLTPEAAAASLNPRLPDGVPLRWIVYILRCADGSLYTGITNDVDRRMADHEAGKGARYTRGRGPFQLVYNEVCKDRGFASKREMEIKSLTRDQKLRLVSRKTGDG